MGWFSFVDERWCLGRLLVAEVFLIGFLRAKSFGPVQSGSFDHF
jgi:hypothetical protein